MLGYAATIVQAAIDVQHITTPKDTRVLLFRSEKRQWLVGWSAKKKIAVEIIINQKRYPLDLRAMPLFFEVENDYLRSMDTGITVKGEMVPGDQQ